MPMRDADGEPLPGDNEDERSTMIGLALDLRAGTRLPPHRHRRHQLLHAVSGAMRVQATGGEWIVPPLRAVWIPADTEHAVTGAALSRCAPCICTAA